MTTYTVGRHAQIAVAVDPTTRKISLSWVAVPPSRRTFATPSAVATLVRALVRALDEIDRLAPTPPDEAPARATPRNTTPGTSTARRAFAPRLPPGTPRGRTAP